LPARDKLIDATDALKEAERQLATGNHLVLVQRGMFGHIGTIITETVLFQGACCNISKALNELSSLRPHLSV